MKDVAGEIHPLLATIQYDSMLPTCGGGIRCLNAFRSPNLDTGLWSSQRCPRVAIRKNGSCFAPKNWPSLAAAWRPENRYSTTTFASSTSKSYL